MNDIMVKALYREAYNFLARVDDNDLEAQLICPITTRAKSLKDLYRRLLNALTTKKINEAIGGVDCLCEPFLDFNPVKVQARYGENHDDLSGKISMNGNVEIIKPFCESALWGATLLSNIGSARTFHAFVEKFLNSQMSFAVLPLLLQEEVKGLTFPMACEFLSDSGYPDYVKPNPKIKQLLFDIGAIYDRDNYETLKFMKEVADSNNTSPWIVNQILRLISAGDSNCKVTSMHCTAFTQNMATILKAFRLEPSFETTSHDDPNRTINWQKYYDKRQRVEGVTRGYLEYDSKCTLNHIPTGEVWASHVSGSCNNFESRYRSLNPYDVKNTLEKMAEKRSLVAAVLIGTAASDIFTQDVEDLPDLFDKGEEPASNSPKDKDNENGNGVRMATGRQVNYIKSQLKKKRIAQKEFLEEWEDEFDSWDEIPFSQVNEILEWIAEQ